jgi:M6 family metalloprotease-like protein
MFVRKILISCLALLSASLLLGGIAYAVPAAPVIHTLNQPDGSSFEARQWGDEWCHGWETLDGYSILFDEDLVSWTYATYGIDGSLISSLRVVGRDTPPGEVSKNIRPKGQARMMIPPKGLSWELSTEIRQGIVPPTGTANIPVILINFSNTTTTYTVTNFNTLLFGTANNSMKDYYEEVSYGAFSVSPGPSGIVGWHQASNNHDYYGTDVGGEGDDAWPGDLVYEAVVAADAAGFNFAAYDEDGDCYVDVVAIVHQGSGQEASPAATDIWSHRWTLNSAQYWGRSNYGEYTTNDTCTADPMKKVKVNDYIIQPETLLGGLTTMGVFAHEYGHALGLPDLYDTDDSSQEISQGIGEWSLMANGSWNYVSMDGDRPAHLDAWCKYKLGWVTPTLVSGTLTNQPIIQEATAADVYQLRIGSPWTGGEYFLVENRQKTGFDAGLPGAGLLIWHIDESKTSNDEECYPGGPSCATYHYHVALVQADNLWNLEKRPNSGGNNGDTGDPYPGSSNNTSFTDTSSPNSKLYNGNTSSVSITSISASGSPMTATMSCPVLNPPILVSPADGATVTLIPTLDWSTITGASNFDVQVCTDVNCSPPARSHNTETNLSQWTVSPDLAPVTTYYWRVRTNNPCGPGSWSGFRSFTTYCPTPQAPLNNAPPNGATGVSTSPTLIWIGQAWTDYYDVYLDTLSDPQTKVGTTTDTSWSLSDLSCNVTYYWRIVAKNACGNSTAGSISHFTAGPTPGTPLNPSPSNGATGVATSLTLSWSASSNADSYDVYFGTSSPPLYLGNTATPNYPVAGLSGNTTHYWKIVAKNNCGKSTSGAVWNFRTYLPGVLSVTPPDGLSSSGPQGGPFSPASKTYTLKNTGGFSIDWTASLAGSSNWITLSSTSGSLAPNATTTVTVSINSNVNSLASGANYSDTLYLTNTTNGNGSTSRGVDVTVYPPGVLEVTPSDDLSSSGPQGGPFSPSNKVYTLKNIGGFSIDWTASLAGSSNWITLSSSSGALAPNGNIPLTVSINSNANTLAPGFNYSDTVSLTNTTNGNGNTSRGIDLTVLCPTPGTPSNPSPSDGATSVTMNPTLGWASSTNTDSYDVYLGTSTDPPYVTNTTSTTYSPSTLNPTTLYYWKIVAKNTCGNSTYGPVWSFTTTVAPPSAPTLASPSNNATRVSITPSLSWNTSSGATSYRLQVSTSNTFSTTVFDQDGIVGTSQAVTELLNNMTYYWRVNATNSSGTSDWSTTWSFTTIVTSVVVSGRQLVVNGSPFTIKGVGYSPVPICDDPEAMSPNGDYFTSGYSAIYDRDLPLLREMGANTIRLWSWNNTADHLDFLDKAYNNGIDPIYVIAGFWINPGLIIDPNYWNNVREEIKDNFRQMVAAHKNHPAILMWAIGNELNGPDMYAGKINYLFSLINEMAQVAHLEEGVNYHPVTTPLLDDSLINTISTYDSSVPLLDIWGVNAYRGNSFGSLFNDYEAVSSKPLVILEYGIDAYDNVNQKEYQDVQAAYVEDLWNEIKANSDVCIGGSVMEYSDEWWKGKHSTDPGCPDNDPCSHSTCGYSAPSHPDGYANEEWWGIMRTVDNGNGPDIMEPKGVYYRLHALWLSIAETVSPPDPPSGPVTGNTGTSYTYSTGGASSNYTHSLEYRFDWGDGTFSDWSSSTSASKSWNKGGLYSVSTQARCAQHTSVVSSWSGTLSVTVTLVPPPSATLISPSPSTIISSNTPTYTWNEVPVAEWYHLWVNDSTGNKINQWYEAIDVCSAGTCSVTPTTEVIGSCQWYIQTYNSTGFGPWSAPLSFTTPIPTPPVAATLVSPSGSITDTTPTYTWNAVSNSTWYCLYVNDATGNKIQQWYAAGTLGCASGTGTCSITPTTEVIGSCQWWVRTYNTTGYGPWSAPLSFTTPIPTPPVAATLVSPSGSITDTTPTYTWKAVSNATWYHLWVNDPTGNKINKWYAASEAGCADGVGICSVTSTTVLSAGVGHWWIRTYNSAGYSPWSAPMDFTVSP